MWPGSGGRRTGAMLAGIALPALLATASVPTGRLRHLPCPRKGAQVIAEDKVMLVYKYPPTREGFAPPGRTEACLVRRGTRMTLFDSEQRRRSFPRTSLGVIALSGTVVAYSIGHYGIDSGSSDVFVADVASRRILRELPGEGFVDAGFISRTRRTDFALSPSGSVAWIDAVSGAHRPANFIVYAAPIGGEQTVLDEGPDIAPRSLDLAARTLSWEHAGARRTALLGP